MFGNKSKTKSNVVKSRKSGKLKNMRIGSGNHQWELGPVIIAFVMVGMMASVLLVRPQVTLFRHTLMVTQGIATVALLMGALFWAVIELFTGKGKGLVDLIVRPFFGFFLGALFGGIMGYYFQFGQYVVIPAWNESIGALYFLAAVITAFLVLDFSAAWAHSRRFVTTAGTGKKMTGLLFMPLATSSTPNGNDIFNSIWNLFMNFFNSLIGIFMNGLSGIANGFTSGVDTMFQSWGFSLAGYGIWGPMMLVASLGIAGFLLYAMLDFYGIEKDVLGAESEL